MDRRILCDEKLKLVMGNSSISMFEMAVRVIEISDTQKLIQKHMTVDGKEEVSIDPKDIKKRKEKKEKKERKRKETTECRNDWLP